ncbi:MAG TPA: glycosyltransferase, partial [Candidatus Dormibacteraeota bacterium]|nr:glycosyltransferase [Candidatus Dormibacteraeota bacterium]
MNIIHVMDHSLPRGDGYCIRAKYLLEAQAARGHAVTVLTSPSQGEDAGDELIDGVTYRRTRYTAAEDGIRRSGGKHAVFGRAIHRGLERLLDESQCDLIHAHTPFTVARVALHSARRRRLPFVYEKRNLWEESARARGKPSGRWPWFQLARSLDRRVTVSADAVCTITEALRMHTIRLGAAPERVFVVGNGVDTDAFAPRAAPAPLRAQCAAGSDRVLGFVGSFFSFEGLPLLIEACAQLRQRFPQLRLVLVGEGEDHPRLAAMVERLQLQRNVWLVGRVPHAKVTEFYSAIDVLVYPRYPSDLTEMISPLKPLEPMAMGRCVVASDVGGLRELIRDGETGLLFKAGSASALAGRLASVLGGEIDTVRLGAQARDYVVNHRQWREMSRC